MKDAMKKLIEFHETYGLGIRKTPGFPNEKERTLRKNLIEEEVNEFHLAQ